MSVYAEDLLAARAMLQEFGVTTVLKRETPPQYDLQTGPQLADPPLEAAVHAVVFPISGRGETFESRALLRTKAREFYLAFAADVETAWKVEPGDLLYFEEQWWPIAGVDPLNPDDTQPLLYSGQMRLP